MHLRCLGGGREQLLAAEASPGHEQPLGQCPGTAWGATLRFGEGRWQQEGWGCTEVSPRTRWAAQGTLVVTFGQAGGCAGQGGAAAVLKD